MIDFEILAQLATWRWLKRSIGAGVVVGTILNAINQGHALLGGASPDWVRLALTYLVPFLVSNYGAYTALRAQKPVLKAARR